MKSFLPLMYHKITPKPAYNYLFSLSHPPGDSFTFCPVSPCPYCPTAFPTCIGRNGVINGFIFDDQLYYRCLDNRMILGRCLSSFDRVKKICNDSGVVTPTTTTTTTVATAATTSTTSEKTVCVAGVWCVCVCVCVCV